MSTTTMNTVSSSTVSPSSTSRAPRVHRARWERPAFLGLLLATGVLYLVNLGVNGYANAFYSAAVQAGSTNWEAFFYGSSDAGNSITVDKPPAFLWVMELSVRLFGLNSWAILVPEALMGVLTVAVLYAIVRRRFSAGAALIAGGALAVTPVAALMFRFNNPDALLTLLMVTSLWCVLRGVDSGRLRWVVWAGVAVGFAFLTKQLQGFVILPVLVGVYLSCSSLPFVKRVAHLFWAALAVVVSGGWWVAIVELVPTSARPYVGGSQTNSFLELTFGYNGLGRVTGDETGSVTGGGGTAGSGSWGATGILRLFGSEFAGQITWLLPTALVLLVASLVAIGFRQRTSSRLATVLALGGALLVTGLVFSFMGGIFHPYYTVALAPYIAGLVGIGAGVLWGRRASWWWRGVAAVAVVVTVVWQWHLLTAASGWQPWIRWVVLVAGVVTAVAVLVPVRRGAVAVLVPVRRGAVDGAETGWEAVPELGDEGTAGAGSGRGSGSGSGSVTGSGRFGVPAGWLRPLGAVVVVGAVVTALLGPTAYSLDTVTTAHTGSLPSAGPSVAGAGFGGGRGGFGGGGRGGFGGAGGTGAAGAAGGAGGAGGTGGAGGVPGTGGTGGTGTGGTGIGGTGTQGGTGGTGGTGTQGGTAAPGAAGGAGARGGFGGGGAGGLFGGSTEVSSSLRTALLEDASDYTWVAATIGSTSAATYQLATGESVMPIGGFNGSDPSPTLAEFQQDVAAGKVHYFIAGSVGRSNGGSDTSTKIAAWVESNFTATTIGGVTVYDLTAG